MQRPVSLIAMGCVAAGMVGSALAAPIARDAALFETLAVEGVSLGTPPEEAFDILTARGYRGDGIASYRDWTHGSLNLVRGSYGAPEGYSSVTIGRSAGRLALITQSLNKRGIDVAAELGSVQSHFNIPADENDCRLNNAGTAGSCQLSDAADPTAATVKLTMTVQSTMILRSISRPAELLNTME